MPTTWTSSEIEVENDITHGEAGLEFDCDRLGPADFDTFPISSQATAVASIGAGSVELY
jgi:hypothetical protein